jgi:hypothetical protein
MKTSRLNRSRGAAWLALVLGIAAAGGTAHAAWIVINPSGDGSVTGVFPTFSIIGSDFRSLEGTVTTTSYANTFDAASTVSFNWSYATVDFESQYDPAGYAVDGNETYLMANSDKFGSGSASVEVPAGSTFRFFVTSIDNRFGRSTFSVTDATVSAVPEPSSSLSLLALGAGGLLARRRRQAA